MANIGSNHTAILKDLLDRVEFLEAQFPELFQAEKPAKVVRRRRGAVQTTDVSQDSGGGPGEEHP